MILNGAENRNHADMIFIDLQKAFDNIDHALLLDKMKCIGFSDKTMVSFLLHKQSFFHYIVP